MATRITITTNEGSSNYTLSTGARGPAGAAGATGPSPAALEFAGSDPNVSGGEYATGHLTINGSLLNNGVVIGSRAYTFRSAYNPSVLDRFAGVFHGDVMQAIAGMVNGTSSYLDGSGDGIFPKYVNPGTLAHADVTATTEIIDDGAGDFDYRVHLTAKVAGIAGNSLALSETGPGIVVSGAFLTGGTDGDDAPTATHLGQWCQASTAWWQWNGTVWQPIRTTEGEPITVDSDGKFYRQFIYDSGFGPAQAFEEITF